VPKKTILGQPAGLATLFLTEMWERFTYYGMRAVLILYLVNASGGFGLDDRTASAIYGLYIAGTYVFSLLGGFIADRLVGAQRAVVAGGVLIVIGNVLLTFDSRRGFFLGLMIIVLGVGLLKPNISAMVAGLYPEGGARRDAGFTIFYMGISVGALLGSLVVPVVAARYGWRYGFALPVIGMLCGLIQFTLTRKWLGQSGLREVARPGGAWWVPALFVALLVAVAGVAVSGKVDIDPVRLSHAATWAMGVLAVAYFVFLLVFAGLNRDERHRVWVMIALFLAYATFYAGFEQGGASMNLFAERYTDRNLFGWELPAGVLQGTTALVTILFAPIFAALWTLLGRRGKDPAAPSKFALGLALLGGGFLVMYGASQWVVGGHKVLPTWLLATYVLQEWGDLCLSPVGLSSMTKLAPARFIGQVMGVWFLALALGNNLAGQLSAEYDANDLGTLPGLFMKIFLSSVIAAALILSLSPWLKRLMAGVK
jgi:POT family proton-dependent oligopeptide transporter